MLPVHRNKERVCSLLFLLHHSPPTPSWQLAGKGWEEKSLLRRAASPSYLTFLSASDSSFCLCCNSGFPSQPHEEPDESLLNSSQQQAG